MVKVYVADGVDFAPVVRAVKGIRSGREWAASEMQDALGYDLDGSVRVRWEEVTSVRRLSKSCHPFARLRTGFEEQSDEKSLKCVLATYFPPVDKRGSISRQSMCNRIDSA